MSWHEKEHNIDFENTPLNGLLFLDGDLLARRYQQEGLMCKKYPIISYPSGLERELRDSPNHTSIINVFGAFELPRLTTRDEGLQNALQFASEYSYTVGRRGDNELLIFNPYSGHGYTVQYDNGARQIVNITRFPKHAMELVTGETRAVLPKLYSNEKLGLNAIAPIKFFTPDANWTWYPTEYDGADTFFGLVSGFEVELGYFSLTELESVRGGLGLPIERDLHFKPTPLKILKQLHQP